MKVYPTTNHLNKKTKGASALESATDLGSYSDDSSYSSFRFRATCAKIHEDNGDVVIFSVSLAAEAVGMIALRRRRQEPKLEVAAAQCRDLNSGSASCFMVSPSSSVAVEANSAIRRRLA
eukprot:SAG31_NODE_75_length_27561_cov_28.859333_3_plen_120_part_00